MANRKVNVRMYTGNVVELDYCGDAPPTKEGARVIIVRDIEGFCFAATFRSSSLNWEVKTGPINLYPIL